MTDLTVEYRAQDTAVRAVRGVSFEVGQGETVALVGESGSGKSTIGFALMGLLPAGTGEVTAGQVEFHGAPLQVSDESAMRTVRGREISMIFQDPLTALNPVLTIGRQLSELFVHHRGMAKREARAAAVDLLRTVRIPEPERRAKQYPQQLSGGMRQRVVVAMALAMGPRLVIADEPTTALDVTVQAHVMALLDELATETGAGSLLITHDLGVVAAHASRVYVLYAGQVMEHGPIREVYERPAHPYTIGLIRSVPRVSAEQGRLQPIPGSPPSLTEELPGCPFHDRCPIATAKCREEKPPLHRFADGRGSACHYAEEVLHGEYREALGATRH